MPKPGYTQSPEHKKKRLEQIEGDGNGSYKDGRRSYRRKAGAKNNDGTVVHHKNGDRTNNCASNLERLTDGDRTPGRRTTSAHEKHHGGRHGDSIALLHHDRKTGGCGKGKVGTGTGGCKAAKGESFLSKAKKKALGGAIGLGVSIPAIAVLNPELRKAYMQTYFPEKRKGNWEPKRDKNGFDNDGFDKEGFDKEGFNDYGFDRQGIHRNGTLYNSKGIDADFYDKSGRDTLEIRPPRFPEGYDPSGEKMENFKKIDKRKSKLLDENAHAVAMIRSLRRSVNKGTSPADLKRNREVRKEYASQVASIARKLRDEGKYDSILPTAIALLHHDRKTGGCGKGKVGTGTGRCKTAKLSQVTPFSHRTPQEADAARREKLLLQAAKVAVGVGVTGGLATIALKGGKHSNPYHDPPDIAPVKKVEPPASPKPVDSPVLKPPLSSREETEESLRSLSRIAPPEKASSPPSVSAPVDKGVTAKIETPANDAPESAKKKWLITKLLPLLPAAGESTDMSNSPYSPLRLKPEDETTLGKPGGRRSKETKAFEEENYRLTPVKGARFKSKAPSPRITRLIDQIPGGLSTNDKEYRRLLRKHINRIRRGQIPGRSP